MAAADELYALMDRAQLSLSELLVTFRSGGPQAVKNLVTFFWNQKETKDLAVIHPGLFNAMCIDPVGLSYFLIVFPDDYKKLISSLDSLVSGSSSELDKEIIFKATKAVQPLSFSLDPRLLEWIFSKLSFTVLPKVEDDLQWLILSYSDYPIKDIADRIIPVLTSSSGTYSNLSSAFPKAGYRIGMASKSTVRFLQLVETLSNDTFHAVLEKKDLSFLDEVQLKKFVLRHDQVSQGYMWATSETMPFCEKLDLICKSRLREISPSISDALVTLILELWKKDDTTFTELTNVFEDSNESTNKV